MLKSKFRTLASVSGVVQVIPSPYKELPSGLHDLLQPFICGPIILDNFRSHDARRRWVGDCYAKWGSESVLTTCFARNPIKRGNLRSAIDLAIMLYPHLGLHPLDQNWYDSLSNQDKVIYINQVRDALVSAV